MPFGAHMSVAGGLARAFARGQQAGCEAMQIFTKSERQWAAKPIAPGVPPRNQHSSCFRCRAPRQPQTMHASHPQCKSSRIYFHAVFLPVS